MWYPKRVPIWLPGCFSQVQWYLNGQESSRLALTFDDGPHPESTPLLLDLLHRCGVKATMFLIGENAEKFSSLVSEIRNEGHQIGAHTMSHLDGWRSSRKTYVQEVKTSLQLLDTKLFRPPFGRIGPCQMHDLQSQATIVMWSLITGDFDRHIDQSAVQHLLHTKVKHRDIILGHDTPTAIAKTLPVLEEFIKCKQKEGYEFVIL